RLDDGNLEAAWGGIASLELLLPAVWTGARARGIEPSQVVRWLSTNPAAVVGLTGRKGDIVPGADADLVAIDLEAEWRVDQHQLLQRHPLTPYHGRVLRGQVERTWLRGQLVFERGASALPTAGEIGAGQMIDREGSR